ncbi:hypothetical protein PHLCEN_2v961 [Hermanssonia centrifuga]|uniref:Uncharacterized protein n=1 Tax=Hermanssonia centrifuga TaxID=98765 RepID=A0A2R6S4H0_9APHY|nr:hypothetical protein PHLCEN_2v961 [Hermanssonia centrifuga]
MGLNARPSSPRVVKDASMEYLLCATRPSRFWDKNNRQSPDEKVDRVVVAVRYLAHDTGNERAPEFT